MRWTLIVLFFLICHGAWADFPGGRVTQIVTAPTNADMVAAVGRHQIWLSDDGGKKWHRVTQFTKINPEPTPLPLSVEADNIFPSSGAPPDNRIRTFPQVEAKKIAEASVLQSSLRLAVSDTGNILFWQKSTHALTICTGVQRCKIVKSLQDVTSLKYDSYGVAWVATPQRLLRFSAQIQISALAIPNILQLVYLPPKKQMITVTRDKLIPLRVKTGDPSSPPFALSNIRAATAFYGSVFVLQKNQLLQLQKEGTFNPIAHISPTAQAFSITHEGIWIQQRENWRMHNPTASSLTPPQPVFDVAIDSHHRTWLATAQGPLKIEVQKSRPTSRRRCEKLTSYEPRKPAALPIFPDEQARSNTYFPTVKLWSRVTSSRSQNIFSTGLPTSQHQVQIQIGLLLAWHFTPRTASSVYEREKHFKRVDRRREHRRTLYQLYLQSCFHPHLTSDNTVEKEIARQNTQKWKTMLSYL